MKYFHLQNRYKEVLHICLPLIMSTAVVTVMEFTDRIFLSNYSINAISAVTPAGILAFLFIAFFSGVSGYSGVLTAQYYGAKNLTKIGAVLWQSIYFSVFSALAFWLISFMGEPVFRLAGHPLEVQNLEIIYFRILCLGGAIHVLECGFSGFFIGRGKTMSVMVANVLGVLINIPLDYAMIYGGWIFPEMGVKGAAAATVISWGIILSIYVFLILVGGYNLKYHVFIARSFNRSIMMKLLRFGIPGSIQFCIDIFAFTFFIFMVGRLGKSELAVTNILIAVNSLSFMPAMGFSQGTGSLVGQSMGARNPAEADDRVVSAVHLILLYTGFIILVYLFFPVELINIFIPSDADPAEYGTVLETGKILLKIITIYVVFDALYMILAGALKGAGDTRFVMWSTALAVIFFMILPIYFGIEHFGLGIYFAWKMLAVFVAALFLSVLLRYLSGRWKDIEVVEKKQDLPA